MTICIQLKKVLFVLLYLLSLICTSYILFHLDYFRHRLPYLIWYSMPNIILLEWVVTDILHRHFTSNISKKWWLLFVTTLNIVGVLFYYVFHMKNEWNNKSTWK